MTDTLQLYRCPKCRLVIAPSGSEGNIGCAHGHPFAECEPFFPRLAPEPAEGTPGWVSHATMVSQIDAAVRAARAEAYEKCAVTVEGLILDISVKYEGDIDRYHECWDELIAALRAATTEGK